MNFELTSNYKPTGDQPEAIKQLTEGINNNIPGQTLLGVTGSGKTFTIANVIDVNTIGTIMSPSLSFIKSFFSLSIIFYSLHP